MKIKNKESNKFNYSIFESFKHYWKGRKTANKYHIELVFAQIGSGKSTDIARTCYKTLKKKKYSYIYTNIDVAIPDVRTFDIQDFNQGNFVFPEDSLILIDEVSLLYDSRSYKAFPKAVGNYLRLSRHYKNTFIFYSQHYDCDKVIRTLANRLFYMQKYGFLTIKRSIKKVISVVTSTDEKTQSADSQICDTLKFESIFKNGALTIICIPFWVKLFDSYETDSSSSSPIPYHSYQSTHPVNSSSLPSFFKDR